MMRAVDGAATAAGLINSREVPPMQHTNAHKRIFSNDMAKYQSLAVSS
jgi:hypothetical protein